MEAKDCEGWLNRWISNYVNSNPDAGQEMKAKYPLAEAKVSVAEIPGKPGSYKRGRVPAPVASVRGTDHLAPHGGPHPEDRLMED